MCDGIGLGMLSKNSPSKRRILKEDIPDNKAFFSCADDCAKSHLKCAEALRIRVVFGIRELLRRFGYFWAPKVTKIKFPHSAAINAKFRQFQRTTDKQGRLQGPSSK